MVVNQSEARISTEHGITDILAIMLIYANLYYNYEKYPLSPLKPRFLVLIEQYLPNISDPVYSVHQLFM